MAMTEGEAETFRRGEEPRRNSIASVVAGEGGELSFFPYIETDTQQGFYKKPLIPCGSKMDGVGGHIESIKKWIEYVHLISRALFKEESCCIKKGGGIIGSIMRSTISSDTSNNEIDMANDLPKDVGVTAELEYSLESLSASVVEEFRKGLGGETMIVGSCSKIPNLMKTIFLIENNEDRSRVLGYPIIKRVMLSKHSVLRDIPMEKIVDETEEGDAEDDECECKFEMFNVNSWLVDVLHSGRPDLRNRVVDYMEILGSITFDDYIFHNVSPCDSFDIASIRNSAHQQFDAHLQELYESIYYLRKLLPSLLLLNDSRIGRASVTPLITNILKRIFSSCPFSLSIVFMELMDHILLLVAGHMIAREVVSMNSDSSHATTLLFGTDISAVYALGNMCVVFSLTRLLKDYYAMISLSRRVFMVHFRTFWNYVDIAYILTVFFAVYIGMRSSTNPKEMNYFTIIAISTGLLWIKLLGFLKILNWELATFVLAIGQILSDIKIFIIVLVIIIFAFGDLLFVIIKTNDVACPVDGSSYENPFCQGTLQSYLGVYRALVGDFSYDYFQSSTVATVLFVFLTFFLMIILLNMLIALVSESYEKSTLNSASLFGMARVKYTAKVVALCSLKFGLQFSKKTDGWLGARIRWLITVIITMSVNLSFFLLIFLVVNVFSGSLVQNQGMDTQTALKFACLLVSPFVYFFCINWLSTMISFGPATSLVKRFRYSFVYKYFIIMPINIIVSRILFTCQVDDEEDTEAWHGRLTYILEGVNQSVDSLEGRLNKILTSVKERQDQSCTKSNQEQEKIEDVRKSVSNLEKRLGTELKEMEKRLADKASTDMVLLEKRLEQNEARVKAERQEEMMMFEQRLFSTLKSALRKK